MVGSSLHNCKLLVDMTTPFTVSSSEIIPKKRFDLD